MKIGVCCIAVALSAAAWADRTLCLGLRQPESEMTLAKRLVGGSARRFERDARTGLIYIRLKPGADARALTARLKRNPDVVVARLCRPEATFETTDLTSLRALSATLAELNAQNADFEKLRAARQLPPPEKTEKIKTGYYEALKFFLEERAYPRDKVDWDAYFRAAAHRDRMNPAAGGAGDTWNLGTWQYFGPTNLDVPYNTYYGIRPTSGRINAIAVDPSNGNTVYLGTANGGVWKTSDGGASWTPLTDHWPFLAVSSLAIDPSNPQTIYAGTGDYPGSRIYSMGVMKSTDGGATWTQYGASTFANRAINALMIDPENPQIIVATTGRGSAGAGPLYRSTNGGVSWSAVITTNVNWADLSMGALNAGSRVYYASGGGTGGNVWRSLDRGATWTKLTTPAAAATNHSVLQVAASKVFPNTVYICVNADRKVYKSIDAGLTWTDVTAGLPATGNSYFWSQSTYNWYLECTSATTPAPRDILFCGFICVEMSVNGGVGWQTIGGPTYNTSGGALTHNDQHSICVDPSDPNKIWIGNDGGIYRYNFNPTTNTGTWTYHSRFMGVSQFYRMADHPTNPDHIMGGTQDNATPHSRGDILNWDNVGGGDGGFCAINWSNPNVQYATAQNLVVYRTGNAWGSSSQISPSTSDPKAFIAPITLDPTNPNLLYAGTNYLNRRNDSGGGWTLRLGNQVLTTGTVRYIAVAPSNGQIIYTGASDGQVWMTRDAGATWTQINTGSPGLPGRVVTCISVNPANPDDVLLTVSGTGTGHVWRCANTTASPRVWQNLNGSGMGSLPDIPTNAIERDPVEFERILWAGTDIGVFVTTDEGASWQNATQPLGLPNTQVNDFRANPNTNFLVAATFGRGFWRMALPPIVYATSCIVTQGAHAGGGVTDLRTSNNARFSVISDEDMPQSEVELLGTSPVASLDEIQIVVEAYATRTDMIRIVELFDYTTNQFVQIDQRPTSTAESTVIVTRTDNPSRFVAPSTRTLRARIRTVPNGDVSGIDGWGLNLDRAFWRVTP